MSYADRVLARPGLIGYWRLNEASGTAVNDSSPYNNDGTATGVTWGATGIGDGATAASFDGNDSITVLAVSGEFDGSAGALLAWFKEQSVTQTSRTIVFLRGDVNNFVEMYYLAVDHKMVCQYRAGGVDRIWEFDEPADTNWHVLAMAWSAAEDRVDFYLDAESGQLNGLGTWGAAGLNTANIGVDASGARPWVGDIAHVALWNTALSDYQLAPLLVVEISLATPITDRTTTDLANRTAKAYWNVADWQRVTDNTESARLLIAEYGGLLVPTHALTAPTIGSYPTAESINLLVENIERTRVAALSHAALKHDYVAGLGAVAPDYVAVNAWESVQLALWDAIPRAASYRVACGVAAAGQPRLWQARFRG